MSEWLIGIVGVVSLGVLIEVLLPEGENSKYIKGIFSIIVIFVIISPFPKLAKGDYIKGFTTATQEIAVDDGYYSDVKEAIQTKIAQNVKTKLDSKGYKDLSFNIKFDEDYIYLIDSIVVEDNTMSDEELQQLIAILQEIVGNVKVEVA